MILDTDKTKEFPISYLTLNVTLELVLHHVLTVSIKMLLFKTCPNKNVQFSSKPAQQPRKGYWSDKPSPGLNMICSDKILPAVFLRQNLCTIKLTAKIEGPRLVCKDQKNHQNQKIHNGAAFGRAK